MFRQNMDLVLNFFTVFEQISLSMDLLLNISIFTVFEQISLKLQYFHSF